MDTKISERNPIKWWINRQPKAIAQTGIGYVAVANYKEEDDAIPCVEFSEYESTVNKLEAENARLREALEFYADLENWYISSQSENLEICNKDGEYIDNQNGEMIPLQSHAILYVGGRRAREALKGGE